MIRFLNFLAANFSEVSRCLAVAYLLFLAVLAAFRRDRSHTGKGDQNGPDWSI